MKRALRILILVVVLAALGGLLVWSYLGHRAETAAEAQADQPIGTASSVARDAAGNTVIKFDEDTQKRLDLHTTALIAVSKRSENVAYGQLEEDPSRSFVLRAPVSGAVRAAAVQPWPEVGQTVPDRSTLGSIEPRLAPADRITLADRQASAQADLDSGRATLAAAQAALTRARTLNADDKNVSDRVVQEAEARVAAEQARVTAAGQSVKLLQSSLASVRDSSAPLEVERGGEVVEVMAHPGESVEAGQPVLRVTRFDRLLARVDVPAGQPIPAGIASANIVPFGAEATPLRGERVALATSVDPKTQGQPFLFRVSDTSSRLRPGLSVTAYLEVPGAPRKGVSLPRTAVVRLSGKAWVYVETAAGQFTRREVTLEEPMAGGWFTRSLSPGGRVVTTGAQVLVSEELKSQIHVEEESQR